MSGGGDGEGLGSHAFIAWLSVSTGGAFARVGGPSFQGSYVNTHGDVIAPTASSLIANGPTNPILYSANGGDAGGQAAQVWTGTLPDGGTPGLPNGPFMNCGDWTNSTTGTAVRGYVGGKAAFWTDNGTSSCDGLAHIFCFEIAK